MSSSIWCSLPYLDNEIGWPSPHSLMISESGSALCSTLSPALIWVTSPSTRMFHPAPWLYFLFCLLTSHLFHSRPQPHWCLPSETGYISAILNSYTLLSAHIELSLSPVFWTVNPNNTHHQPHQDHQSFVSSTFYWPFLLFPNSGLTVYCFNYFLASALYSSVPLFNHPLTHFRKILTFISLTAHILDTYTQTATKSGRKKQTQAAT